MQEKIKDKSVVLEKSPFTTNEVAVISAALKKVIGSDDSGEAYEKAKSRLEATTLHMEQYELLKSFYEMLPEEARENFSIPIGRVEHSDEEKKLIKKHLKDEKFDEVIKLIGETFKNNKDKIDMIKFDDLKPFHETLKSQVKVFEVMKMIMNKCDAIVDYHGDTWEGTLEDAFKDR